MRFTDYMRDRLSCIALYFFSNFLVILIMMLDLIIRKERLNISSMIYALILSSIFLVLFVTIDYMRKRKFYRIIHHALKDEDNLEYIFNLPDDLSKEYDIFKELLIRNYTLYKNELERYKKTHKIQMDFNNRWIHQMKTPVSVIRLLLEREKDKNIDEKTKNSYDSIEEEIEKLSHGLNMALYTLRLNDFEMDFKVEEANLLKIVRDVINENKNAFIVNSIYPKILSEESFMVKTDKKWIKFVINQIISNSIKYSKVKQIDNKSINISAHSKEDKTMLCIKDNGVGIPKQDLERVFDPFFTGKNGRTYSESTGMGLYLSKDILKRLGHDINVESSHGEGTQVSVIFYRGKSIYDL